MSEIAKAKAALPAGEWNGKNAGGGKERQRRRSSSKGGGGSGGCSGGSGGGSGGNGGGESDDDDEPPAAAPLAAAEAVVRGHGPGGDLRKLLKNGKPPRLLAALCGSRVSVVTPSRKAAIALKEEYHAFRDRGGVILTGELRKFCFTKRERRDKRKDKKSSLLFSFLFFPNSFLSFLSFQTLSQWPPWPSCWASAARTPAPQRGTGSLWPRP